MRGIDLNIFKVLAVLLETKSTTLTAEKINSSQPAISRKLKNLRAIFNDDLLVRNGATMELTPKAESLKASLPARLEALYELTDELLPFDPNKQQGELTIAMNSSIAHWMAAPLIGKISKLAPMIRLNLIDWTESAPGLILSGQVQYGINYFPMELPKNFVQKKGGEDSFVFACRRDHPLKGSTLTWEHFDQYPIAIHIIQDWNDREEHVTRLLRFHGKEPLIKLRTTHMNVLLESIKNSDMIYPCSRFLANQLGADYTYIEVDPNLPRPEGNFGFVYGLKWRGDKSIIWLDTVAREVANELLSKHSG